jgi:WD40 repeat protein
LSTQGEIAVTSPNQERSRSTYLVAVTRDGKCAVSASHDKTLKMWDLETGKLVGAFTADAALLSCAVVADGRVIVAGDGSGRVHFLSLELKDNN